tara:strand:- start:2647 stop:3708 length:1062 start_codon:yes stop_codon:yes gene_type:complete
MSNINSYGFVFPIWYYRNLLRASGIKIRFFDCLDDHLPSADTIFLDSKVLKNNWLVGEEEGLRQIEFVRNRCDKLLWTNTSDGTGAIQRQVMPFVDYYLKSQIFSNQKDYQSSYYGDRAYTDFYHRTRGVVDHDELSTHGLTSTEIAKLRLSWNFGMANYFSHSRAVISQILKYTRFIPVRGYPDLATVAKRLSRANYLDRPVLFSARLSSNYSRNTVSYQRKQIKTRLTAMSIPLDRLSQRQYFRELASSRFSFSPFGWGEVNIRDFESIIAGAVLIKPDMSHIDTYPNVYQYNQSYIPIKWDLSDLEDVMASLRSSDCADIALEALDQYKKCIGKSGEADFVGRIYSLLGL